MYIDQKDVAKMTKMMNQVSRSGLPIVARQTLNDMAFQARQAMQNQVEKEFTNRNKWTKNSIKVQKANQYHITEMEARTGSTEGYMKTQNDGGHIRAKKDSKPIAMLSARTGKSQRGIPRKTYRLSNLKLGGKLFYTNKTGTPGIFIRLRKRKIAKLWDLSNKEVNIKKTNWMNDAVDRMPLKMLSVNNFKKNFDKWWSKNGY